MKKGGILHPELCALLASTGHTDHVTICDRGFPVPFGPQRIDLALVDDIPTVPDVLRAVSGEFTYDRIIITREMTEVSPQRVEELRAIAGDVPLEIMSHVDFKHLCESARATVRTGDSTPYANIIIVSG